MNNEPIDYTKIQVACQLCGKWLRIWQYDEHYARCLDIEYLASIAKEKGEDFTREDLEDCRSEVINKLIAKYPPEKVIK